MAAIDSQISLLIEAGDLASIVSFCEEAEVDAVALTSNFYTTFILSYLIQDAKDNARFVWKRTPEALKANQELSAAWNIGRALWQKDASAVHASLSAFAWSAPIAVLVQRLRESYQSRALVLISKAFSKVPASEVAPILHISEAEAVAHCTTQLGWTFDAAKNLLFPKKPEAISKAAAASREEGLRRIEALTSYALFLEK